MKEILIEEHKSGIKVCVVNNGLLEEFWHERGDDSDIVGNIYKGKVVNVLQGMQACFVDIGLKRNGFLYGGDVCYNGVMASFNGTNAPEKLPLKEGDIVMVQVLKDEFGEKGARVTMNISLPGRMLVMTPLVDHVAVSRKIVDEDVKSRLEETITKMRKEKSYGYIVRTESSMANNEELQYDMDSLLAKWKKVQSDFITMPVYTKLYSESDLVVRAVRDMMQSDVDKVIVNNPNLLELIKSEYAYVYEKNPQMFELYQAKDSLISHYGLTVQIDALLKRKVDLSNGAYIIIDRTEALTVIDVNTGKYVGEKSLEKTVFLTNKIAAIEIARQLRLRNLGGIIIIDFIDMQDEEHRKEVIDILGRELKKDRIKCSIIGMTDLGLVQVTRKKTRNNINSMLLQTCPYCHGDAYVLSEEHIIMRIREYLFEILKDHTIKAVKLTVNPLVFTKLFTLHFLEKECADIWADIRIYVIPDVMYHLEKFTVNQIRSSIIDLPDTAKLLY